MTVNALQKLFKSCSLHRSKHKCGGYPYEYGELLTTLVLTYKPDRILEIGTGLGYTTVCLYKGNTASSIDTLDQDGKHLVQARKNWRKYSPDGKISVFEGKAEQILPTLTPFYDLIFFDAYAPSMKFLIHFNRLLKIGGLLITANLFVKDNSGGKYLRNIKKEGLWQTGVFADTAISVKLR